MDDFFTRLVDRHAAQAAEGKHDERCEWRPDGFYICNCSARKRIASGYTEPPGELIHQYPVCPRCDEEVSHDGDSYVCSRCSVWWDESGDAHFNDDHGDLTESLAKHEAALALSASVPTDRSEK
jgi:hypothetical protein